LGEIIDNCTEGEHAKRLQQCNGNELPAAVVDSTDKPWTNWGEGWGKRICDFSFGKIQIQARHHPSCY